MILAFVGRVHPGEEEAVVSKFAEELISEGKRIGRMEGWMEGRSEGRSEGRIEGKAELLLALLRRRFGAVPEPWRRAVLAADAGQLEAWGQAIFDAASLEDLLGPAPCH